jgi:hypothetical protein
VIAEAPSGSFGVFSDSSAACGPCAQGRKLQTGRTQRKTASTVSSGLVLKQIFAFGANKDTVVRFLLKRGLCDTFRGLAEIDQANLYIETQILKVLCRCVYAQAQFFGSSPESVRTPGFMRVLR